MKVKHDNENDHERGRPVRPSASKPPPPHCPLLINYLTTATAIATAAALG